MIDLDAIEAALDARCVKCGEARSEHDYRHPFTAPETTDPAWLSELVAEVRRYKQDFLNACEMQAKDCMRADKAEAEVRRLRATVDTLRAIRDANRCSDHGCAWGHRGGMGTNGGCTVDKMNSHEMRRELRMVAKAINIAVTAYDANGGEA